MAGSLEYILGNQWAFSEGSGTSAADSADSNNLSLTGSPLWVPGRNSSYALEFTGGSSQYGQGGVNWSGTVTYPRLNNIYFWLIRFWFKTGTASGRAIVGIRQSSGSDNVCSYIGTDGKFRFFVPSILSSGTVFSSANSVADGEWHEGIIAHCGPTAAKMRAWVYLDGDQIGYSSTGTNLAFSNSAAPVRIGGGIWINSSRAGANATPSDTAGWTGVIDNVDVFWWNEDLGTSACAATAAIEEIITYQKSVTNAMMFSCNT